MAEKSVIGELVRLRDHVVDLAHFADERMFAEMSEGIPLIVESAEELDEAGRQLFEAGEFRASTIIKGLAEEEAAKVLILLDSVRCPPDPKSKKKCLRGFYQHLAKRVYSAVNSLPNILSFGELSEFVEYECETFYLDGPRGVDWIFTNAITTERENKMYVDYVRDITEPKGKYNWSVPQVLPPLVGTYQHPPVVRLARALCDAGASSAPGLACIAGLWRGFRPESGTSRADLRCVIERTLERLDKEHIGAINQVAASLILSEWSFPLWPLNLVKSNSRGGSLEELQAKRRSAIERIEKIEARREPRPAITRVKVEAMSNAHDAWRKEVAERTATRDSSAGEKLKPRSLADLAAERDLPSYMRMKEMFVELSDHERTVLLALAWFTRDAVADWPKAYAKATASYPTLDQMYQLGLGRNWLAGLNRWEESPSRFELGRWHSII